MNEPKICPFCGDVGTLNADEQRKVVYCRCKNCGARGPIIAYNGREIEKEIAIEMFFNAIALADFLADARGMIAGALIPHAPTEPAQGAIALTVRSD